MIGIIGVITIVFNGLMMVLGWCWIAIRRVKCGKANDCHDWECSMKKYCDRATRDPSPAEIVELRKLLAEYESKRRIENG